MEEEAAKAQNLPAMIFPIGYWFRLALLPGQHFIGRWAGLPTRGYILGPFVSRAHPEACQKLSATCYLSRQ